MTATTSPQKKPIIQPEEIAIINKCIKDGDVVFDVGAYHGEWSKSVLANRQCALHLFEASPEAYEKLRSSSFSKKALSHVAVADAPGELKFHVYPDKPRLSSMYRRHSVESKLMQSGYQTYSVPSIRLDDYWPKENGLINFLKIDVEGAEYDVIRGANDLLRRGAVDYIQFEYGGTFKDAKTTLQSVYYYLRRLGYHLFHISGETFSHVTQFDHGLENYRYANYLAVNERHLSRFTGEKPKIEIYHRELEKLGIDVTGVVHIGAHAGAEVETYRERKINPIILVEANPEYASRLEKTHETATDITVVKKAISDKSGTVDFNIASSDQSSSILALKTHAELYPKITYTNKIKVPATTLDDCMSAQYANMEDRKRVNLLVMDIQGAEMMALRGGTETLSHIDAIQLEVNYEELYEGCASIWELDDFLADHGFVRYKTDTPFDRSWGDGLYVRQPIITNSTVGKLGRFGNHFFQYLFLSCHAKDMGFKFENTQWVGDQIFNPQPGVECDHVGLRHLLQTDYTTDGCDILNSEDRLANVDLKGFFQYKTTYYKLHRATILKELSFKGEYAKRAQHIASVFKERDGITVGVHLRRGDYGNRFFYITPSAWYVEWIRQLQKEHSKITVYIASDELHKVAKDFEEFDVLTSADFDNAGPKDPQFFDDFAALTLCDKVAISNSSFSFAATMLNVTGDEFLRPDLAVKTLVSYDPWNAEPLIRSEHAEDHGIEFTKAGNE